MKCKCESTYDPKPQVQQHCTILKLIALSSRVILPWEIHSLALRREATSTGRFPSRSTSAWTKQSPSRKRVWQYDSQIQSQEGWPPSGTPKQVPTLYYKRGHMRSLTFQSDPSTISETSSGWKTKPMSAVPYLTCARGFEGCELRDTGAGFSIMILSACWWHLQQKRRRRIKQHWARGRITSILGHETISNIITSGIHHMTTEPHFRGHSVLQFHAVLSPTLNPCNVPHRFRREKRFSPTQHHIIQKHILEISKEFCRKERQQTWPGCQA